MLSFRVTHRLLTPIIAVMLLTISFGAAQSPESNQEQKLLALVKDIQAQQAQMAENEGKIEQKLNELANTIREARIYTKRSK
ncbi:MAG TPA: hypothetical protein VH170_01580 [Chthoniobacterales bacterium]|nr:hypothetical protein [Chthoniobacterales bacterium]